MSDEDEFDAKARHHFYRLLESLERVTEAINRSTEATLNLTRSLHMSTSSLDTALAALAIQVTNNTSAIASAETVISGIAAQIATAVAAALAAGATPAQLQAITDLGTTLTADDAGLAAAIVASTPAAKKS